MYNYYIFQWHITDRCDQRCKHCYIYAENKTKKIDEVTFKEAEATIHNCIAFCNQINKRPYFCITGGDPLLHNDFWKIVNILKNNNIHFTIMGNPFHINTETTKKLKEYGCDCYQMSLDGLQETHDWFRKRGSFEETLNKILCINEANIMSAIMTTVSHKNIDEITELMEIVAKENIGVFGFSRYCQTSKNKDIGINPHEYKQLLSDCDKKERELRNKGYKTVFNKKDHLWALYEYESNNDTSSIENYHACSCISKHLTIVPTGDIYICRRILNVDRIGNIFDDVLFEIYNNALKKYKDVSKYKKCNSCEIREKCLGCPAVASSTTGDIFSADPQCWKANNT